MNAVREIAEDAAVGVGVADTPKALAAIREPGCAAAIWRRAPLPHFQSWIDGLTADELPSLRTVLRPDRVREALQSSSGGPACAERDLLIDDIAALVDMFARAMDAPYLRVRLDVVTSNSCRKFHIDAVTARLICTYRGTGTQYGVSTEGETPTNIFTTPTGSPIILRGTLWPEEPISGLLHRSPPIEGTGETRLLLVLDPVADLDGEVLAPDAVRH